MAADGLLERYISPELRAVAAGYAELGFTSLKNNDYYIHLGSTVAFGALLWLKDAYALNVVLGIAGVVVYKKCSEQVMTLGLEIKQRAEESKSIRLICLVSTFALSTLCPWRAASFVFGYYVASTYFENNLAAPDVSPGPPSADVAARAAVAAVAAAVLHQVEAPTPPNAEEASDEVDEPLPPPQQQPQS